MTNHNKKLRWHSNIHIYSLSLAIGDAHYLIDKIKSGDAYFNYFYNDDHRKDEPEGFVNEVDNIIGKTVNCFTLNKGGGGWFPIFDSYLKGRKYIDIDSYYIDYGAAYNTPYFQRPKCFFEKEHIKILNEMIAKSLENKPIFNLSFPSKKILFMETKDEVFFNLEDKIKIDYSQTASKIFEDLLTIYDNEYYADKKKKISFINFDHPTTEFTYDFHLARLASSEFEVYKVESLVKDIDWYATYYSKFHTDDKDIYKKQKVSAESQQKLDEWMSGQLLGLDMKEILKKANYDPTSPAIEGFKRDVEQNGFLHGYYLKAK